MKYHRVSSVILGTILVPVLLSPAYGTPQAVLETQKLESGENIFRLRVSELEPTAKAPLLRPVEGHVYKVVAVPSDPGDAPATASGWTYLGLYREPSPRKFVLLAAAETLPAAELRELAIVEPAMPARPGKDLTEAWMKARLQVVRYQLLAPDEPDGFWRYQERYLSHRVEGGRFKAGSQEAVARQRPDGFLASLELVTGMSAIEESLQLSVMQDFTEGVSTKVALPRVRLNELEAPTIQSHDFVELSKGLEPGTIPETSKLCPEDSLYLGFSSLARLLHLADDVEMVQSAAGRLSELLHSEGGTGSFVTRLGLRLDPTLRPFYDLAVASVAVVLDDPYLSEGPELSLVFETRVETGFDLRIAQFDRETLAAHPGLAPRDIEYQGHPIHILRSDDGSIRSFRASVGAFRIFSTSQAALQRILDASDGRIPALANAPDFKYGRAVLPGGDGFLYISDSCVRRFVSPAFKIGELRRVQCAGNMRVLGYATDLSDLEANPQRSVESLRKVGYLKGHPRCPQSGDYVYDESVRQFRCSVHGTLDDLARLSEAPLNTVSAREADDYRNFVENYHRYWPTYFDPIAVKIEVGAKLKFSTCILPLIDSSTYRWLKMGAGGTPRALKWSDSALSSLGVLFTMKMTLFDPDWSGLADDEKRELDEMKSFARTFLFAGIPWDRSEDKLAWIGSELTLVGLDNPVDSFANANDGIGAVRIAIVNPELTEYLVRQLAKMSPNEFGPIRTTGLPPGVRLRVAGVGSADKAELAITDDSLLIVWGGSEKPGAWTDRMLNLLPSKAPAESPPSVLSNAYFGVNLGQLPQVIHTSLTQAETLHSERCLRNLARLEDLCAFEAFAGATIDEIRSRTRSALALACPDGGVYQRRGEEITCAVHGTRRAPVKLTEPPESSPLSRLVRSLDRISASLAFTPEGIRTWLELPSPTARP